MIFRCGVEAMFVSVRAKPCVSSVACDGLVLHSFSRLLAFLVPIEDALERFPDGTCFDPE